MADPALDFLRDRIAAAIGGRAKAMAFEKGKKPSFSRKTLQSWIDGRTWPDAAELVELAELTGRPLSFFLADRAASLPPPPAQAGVLVPVMDVRASAGAGAIAEVVRAVDEIELPRSFLRKIGGEGRRLECLRAAGTSMLPTIHDNALLVVDRNMRPPPYKSPPRKAQRRPQPQDDIYVFYQGTDVRLKRLRNLSHDLMAVISDNIAEYPIEIFKPGADGPFEIVAGVVWWDNRL